jgi:hypothetical protein
LTIDIAVAPNFAAATNEELSSGRGYSTAGVAPARVCDRTAYDTPFEAKGNPFARAAVYKVPRPTARADGRENQLRPARPCIDEEVDEVRWGTASDAASHRGRHPTRVVFVEAQREKGPADGRVAINARASTNKCSGRRDLIQGERERERERARDWGQIKINPEKVQVYLAVETGHHKRRHGRVTSRNGARHIQCCCTARCKKHSDNVISVMFGSPRKCPRPTRVGPVRK